MMPKIAFDGKVKMILLLHWGVLINSKVFTSNVDYFENRERIHWARKASYLHLCPSVLNTISLDLACCPTLSEQLRKVVSPALSCRELFLACGFAVAPEIVPLLFKVHPILLSFYQFLLLSPCSVNPVCVHMSVCPCVYDITKVCLAAVAMFLYLHHCILLYYGLLLRIFQVKI